MKQSGSDVYAFKLAAHKHVKDNLNTDFNVFDFCKLTVTCLDAARGHIMFPGGLAKLAKTFVDVDRFY